MIQVHGNLHKFCDGCPHLELIEIAHNMYGTKIYGCNNSQLCLQLWQHLGDHLKNKFSVTDGEDE